MDKSLPPSQPIVEACFQQSDNVKNEKQKKAARNESNHKKVLPASGPLNSFDEAMTKAAIAIRENKDVRCDKEEHIIHSTTDDAIAEDMYRNIAEICLLSFAFLQKCEPPDTQ